MYSVDFSLYFANSGLKTRLSLLNTGQAWWTLLVLILLASAAKIFPVTMATKLCTRKSWYYCASMGVLMNTRGIIQLVVLNIGVQFNVISPVIFAMFVLMATIITFLTSPTLYFLYRRHSDPKVVEESKTAHELHLVLEGENNLQGTKDDIIIISQQQILNGSRNHHLSCPHTITNGERNRSTIHNNVHPKRHSRMTLF